MSESTEYRSLLDELCAINAEADAWAWGHCKPRGGREKENEDLPGPGARSTCIQEENNLPHPGNVPCDTSVEASCVVLGSEGESFLTQFHYHDSSDFADKLIRAINVDDDTTSATEMNRMTFDTGEGSLFAVQDALITQELLALTTKERVNVNVIDKSDEELFKNSFQDSTEPTCEPLYSERRSHSRFPYGQNYSDAQVKGAKNVGESPAADSNDTNLIVAESENLIDSSDEEEFSERSIRSSFYSQEVVVPRATTWTPTLSETSGYQTPPDARSDEDMEFNENPNGADSDDGFKYTLSALYDAFDNCDVETVKKFYEKISDTTYDPFNNKRRAWSRFPYGRNDSDAQVGAKNVDTPAVVSRRTATNETQAIVKRPESTGQPPSTSCLQRDVSKKTAAKATPTPPAKNVRESTGAIPKTVINPPVTKAAAKSRNTRTPRLPAEKLKTSGEKKPPRSRKIKNTQRAADMWQSSNDFERNDESQTVINPPVSKAAAKSRNTRTPRLPAEKLKTSGEKKPPRSRKIKNTQRAADNMWQSSNDLEGSSKPKGREESRISEKHDVLGTDVTSVSKKRKGIRKCLPKVSSNSQVPPPLQKSRVKAQPEKHYATVYDQYKDEVEIIQRMREAYQRKKPKMIDPFNELAYLGDLKSVVSLPLNLPNIDGETIKETQPLKVKNAKAAITRKQKYCLPTMGKAIGVPEIKSNVPSSLVTCTEAANPKEKPYFLSGPMSLPSPQMVTLITCAEPPVPTEEPNLSNGLWQIPSIFPMMTLIATCTEAETQEQENFANNKSNKKAVNNAIKKSMASNPKAPRQAQGEKPNVAPRKGRKTGIGAKIKEIEIVNLVPTPSGAEAYFDGRYGNYKRIAPKPTLIQDYQNEKLLVTPFGPILLTRDMSAGPFETFIITDLEIETSDGACSLTTAPLLPHEIPPASWNDGINNDSLFEHEETVETVSAACLEEPEASEVNNVGGTGLVKVQTTKTTAPEGSMASNDGSQSKAEAVEKAAATEDEPSSKTYTDEAAAMEANQLNSIVNLGCHEDKQQGKPQKRKNPKQSMVAEKKKKLESVNPRPAHSKRGKARAKKAPKKNERFLVASAECVITEKVAGSDLSETTDIYLAAPLKAFPSNEQSQDSSGLVVLDAEMQKPIEDMMCDEVAAVDFWDLSGKDLHLHYVAEQMGEFLIFKKREVVLGLPAANETGVPSLINDTSEYAFPAVDSNLGEVIAAQPIEIDPNTYDMAEIAFPTVDFTMGEVIAAQPIEIDPNTYDMAEIAFPTVDFTVGEVIAAQPIEIDPNTYDMAEIAFPTVDFTVGEVTGAQPIEIDPNTYDMAEIAFPTVDFTVLALSNDPDDNMNEVSQ